jgi:hypothetical protein
MASWSAILVVAAKDVAITSSVAEASAVQDLPGVLLDTGQAGLGLLGT